LRLFADEHLARSIILALQSDGHDVVAIADVAAGASDAANIDRAVSDRRGLLTFDSDYGDLIFHGGRAAPVSIIYVRMDPRDVGAIASRLVAVLRLVPAEGRMIVVEGERVRTRAFPDVRNT